MMFRMVLSFIVVTFLSLGCSADKFRATAESPDNKDGSGKLQSGNGDADGDGRPDDAAKAGPGQREVNDRFVQNGFTEKYDFLWVIDNSGSMSNIRDLMSQRLTQFTGILESRQSMDWQMAVTSTDNAARHGNLIASDSGLRVVGKNTTSFGSEWASLVSNIRDSSTSYWEQGLESGKSAIDSYGSEFMRPGVPLIISYVSDEQDFSCQGNCFGSGVYPENSTAWTPFPVSRYVSHLNNLSTQRGAAIHAYSIVHLSTPQSCGDNQGSSGGRYIEVANAVGAGQPLSICSNAIETSFAQVANQASSLSACFKLSAVPASTDNLIVEVNDVRKSPSRASGYLYEAGDNQICFYGSQVPQNNDRVEVYYVAPGT